ncbi:glycoside hydrolase family 35 protein [Macrolepiota fuliginosa MF-IS2]|uniref:beta-galactosidase n=1 Tax=Macrolepiota fuliginosa MF-IS2 TaxID=1400762 RepID=A0A9P5X9X9_9AGAR|nr:glycoside hydrolase family 35 protein [Macrolepiota fuliginosa MF-IS2]
MIFTMKRLLTFVLGAFYLTCGTAINVQRRQSTADHSNQYILPVGSPDFYNGQSNASVTFDQHSVLLDGKRIMFFSGEFHPFRLPAPELWKDVLQKFKAAGFNGVSVYWHWGLTAPNSKEVRFTQHNDLKRFYETAKEVGLLVIVRPGPYVNAETAGGGIPGWVTNIAGLARTNATDYKDAWLPYLEGFAKETTPYQYPNGPVIAIQSENEYATTAQQHIPGLDEHMQDIIDTLRNNGITKIPTIHNDKNPSGQYAMKGLGKVDLYGWDGYPLGFDCDKPTQWNELSTQADTSHQTWNPAEPLALFEWQGGAFSYWSGPGYDDCYLLINEQFANVYYKNNYAAEAALQNLYMTYGGTNWGNMHTHTIYSSYDYGAAIREDRTLSPKLDELKLQAYFLHASPDYLTVGRIGNGTVGLGTAYSDSPDIYTTHLHSPDHGTNFYIIRQATNQKTTNTDFKLRINATDLGEITVPTNGSITLAGRESKILVSDYVFGTSKLVYSTAEVMTWATFDNVDNIIVYALEGQYVELQVSAKSISGLSKIGADSITTTVGERSILISGTVSGLSIIGFGKTHILVADKKTASAFWAPKISNEGHYTQYDASPDVPSVFIRGPYLVRSVSSQGSTLAFTGDINGTTTIDVFAPAKYRSVSWNGVGVKVAKSQLGSLRGVVEFSDGLNEVRVPSMADVEWSCADSLPELAADYDDSDWVLANKTTTKRPQQPFSGKYVLYSSEYGFHAGQWVWRGHFSGNATGVELTIQGGFSFGYSAFLNGHFLGSGEGSSHSQDGVDILRPTFNFTQDILINGDNVLTIIHDSTGMNQDYDINDEFKTPRGIRGYRLLSDDLDNDFTGWRLAGNFGGENAPDFVRGPYNEGGWWFERIGAHLPGFNVSKWDKSCSPLQGRTTPGVTVYRTAFDLSFPPGSDIPLAFDFALDSDHPHRVLIYVNGWQFGRFLSTHGPQVSYPIPEGILNHYGTNEILISLWALDQSGARLSKLDLTKRAVISSSKAQTVNIVPAPGWKELRG